MNIHPDSVIRAKELRYNMSDAEQKFWRAIRNNKTGFQFRRQHRIGKYFADFVCIEKRLVIELDGFQHFTEDAMKYDNDRTDYIKSRAWNLIRIPNIHIKKNLNNVMACLEMVLNDKLKPQDIDGFFEKYDNP